MFHNIKGKKHGIKFVIKGKKVFLCDTNLNYVNVKIYRTTALAMRCMIFGRVCQNRHILFFLSQSPDFLKPGLCYVVKFL